MSAGFTRILVPLDGSRLAESALPITTLLAERLDARIHLLHILENDPPPTVHGEPHLTSVAAAERYLTAVASRFPPGVPVDWHVHGTQERNVAASVAAHVAELAADGVALCTHGPSDLRRAVMGSIGQQVLRRTTVPVLMVRPGGASPQLRDLLLPLDGTADGEVALPLAAAIARAAGATVHLLRVVPTVGALTGDLPAAARLNPAATAAALDVEEDQACTYLTMLAERLGAEGVPAVARVERGETVRLVTEQAATIPADLLVLATHAHAGWDAFWIGSVAAGLLGRVPQPLLLVRLPAPRP